MVCSFFVTSSSQIKQLNNSLAINTRKSNPFSQYNIFNLAHYLGDNCNLVFFRPITPEHTVSARCVILSVGFKNLLIWIIGVHQRTELMRFKARVTRIFLQKFYTLINLFKKPLCWLQKAQAFRCTRVFRPAPMSVINLKKYAVISLGPQSPKSGFPSTLRATLSTNSKSRETMAPQPSNLRRWS